MRDSLEDNNIKALSKLNLCIYFLYSMQYYDSKAAKTFITLWIIQSIWGSCAEHSAGIPRATEINRISSDQPDSLWTLTSKDFFKPVH